jgi:hypothetical protein
MENCDSSAPSLVLGVLCVLCGEWVFFVTAEHAEIAE